MTKKQIAVAAAAVLTAAASTLSQCKDETPVLPSQGVTVSPDAGAR